MWVPAGAAHARRALNARRVHGRGHGPLLQQRVGGSADDTLLQALSGTVNGIAAGVQNIGQQRF